MNTFFQEFVDPFQPGSFTIRAEHYMRYIFARDSIQHLKKKATTIYDLGCGNGYGIRILAKETQKNEISYYGFDSSTSLLPQTPKDPSHYYSHLNFDKHSLSAFVKEKSLPSPEVVLAFEILEHLEHPEILTSEIYTLLPKKGILILSVPNEKYEPKKKGKSKNIYHKHLFTEAKLKDMLKNAGFTKLTFYGQPKANQFYHLPKFLVRSTDRLIKLFPFLFPPLAHLIATPQKHTAQDSYSYIVVATK